VKKTRDDTFIGMPQGLVNRLESVAWIGGCTDTNEFNYLVVKSKAAPWGCAFRNRAKLTALRSQVWDQRLAGAQ
jgi:hypothetical protein